MLKMISQFSSRILPPKTYSVNEPEDITDEIEKSLWAIKDSFDLPTEEVEKSISGYRKRDKRE